MTKKDKSTEEVILEAANKVFLEKGLDGARMQEIADEAKINKSLLHYYYRSKDKLFAEVFNKVMKTFLPDSIRIFEKDASLFDKIKTFTNEYISLLQRNPFLPMFVLHELSRKPKKLVDAFSKLLNTLKDKQIRMLNEQINKEIEAGIIKPITVEQFIVNMLSLCIFPFVGQPIILKLFFDDDKDMFNEFIEKRKEDVAEFIIQSIKVK